MGNLLYIRNFVPLTYHSRYNGHLSRYRYSTISPIITYKPITKYTTSLQPYNMFYFFCFTVLCPLRNSVDIVFFLGYYCYFYDRLFFPLF